MNESHFIKNEFFVSVLLNQLMVKHGLQGWKYGFGYSKDCGGWTYYDDETDEGEIIISKDFINAPNITFQDIKDVVLHEIAHALDKNKNGHNEIWKKIATDIGCKQKGFCCKNFKVPLTRFKYAHKCPDGCVATRCFRPKKPMICRKHKNKMKLLKNKKYKPIKRRKIKLNEIK